jgi:hypothetical protein
MEDSIKNYIQTNALHGFELFVGDDLPVIHCPTIEAIGKNLFPYLYCVNKYIEAYEDDKEKVYFDIIKSEETMAEFLFFINFFITYEKLEFIEGSLVLDADKSIGFNNISLFIEIIKILHHRDKKDDHYKPANKIAEEMMKRAKKLKKEMEQKLSQKNGIGFLEISSTVSARHPSINLLNINKLNYFQIIDQYKRLMSIDKYTPCLYGNATEEYIKNNNVKHYSEKLVNE